MGGDGGSGGGVEVRKGMCPGPCIRTPNLLCVGRDGGLGIVYHSVEGDEWSLHRESPPILMWNGGDNRVSVLVHVG